MSSKLKQFVPWRIVDILLSKFRLETQCTYSSFYLQ
jgi:hypothetical protein